MKNLLQGVHHFQTQVFPHHRERFSELAQGQSPSTLFITCSDARIDPSMLTQTAPGELFVLRNAGNLVPAPGWSEGGEAAAIEYAVEALGVRNVVVCGHVGCGAVGGLLEPSSVASLPAVRRWLQQHGEETRYRIAQSRVSEDLPRFAVEENVRVQLERLARYPAVRRRLRSRRTPIELHGWVYDIGAGAVSLLGESGEFEHLAA